APIGKQKVITKYTEPKPDEFYGDSKLQTVIKLNSLASDDFNIAIIRPPMVYGEVSKGNYPKLFKLAKYTYIFPNINNQ
ncbi:NAD-dependent epimerase, partial [Francisella tularensis subsp. holarctica]|nr:NAD-dependent epimerase [Francisella tularensis subsp. holarctica]